MDYKKRFLEWCNKIINYMEWDFEKEEAEYNKTKSRFITNEEDLKKSIQKAISEIDINYGRGITSMYDRIITDRNAYCVGFNAYFGYNTIEEFTPENIEEQQTLALLIYELIELYNDWNGGEFKAIMNAVGASHQFNNPNFTINPSILEAVNSLVQDNRFSIYKYKDGGDSINQGDKFHIASQIGLSSDLTLWLNHIQNQEEFLSKQNEDEIFVTMFGAIDIVHPILSNWIITLHKGKTIWLVTDRINFDNPHQKHQRLNRRSIWRNRDSLYETCDLPYELFHDLQPLRDATTTLVNTDYCRTIPFTKKDYNPTNKHFFSDEKDGEAKLIKAGMVKVLDGVDYTTIEVIDNGHGSFTKYNEARIKYNGDLIGFWLKDNESIVIYNKPEFLFHDFSKLEDGQKAFLLLLVNELIEFCGIPDFKIKNIVLAKEFTEQKLLINAEINPNDRNSSRMECWDAENEAIFNELLETIELVHGAKTQALTIKTYDVVLQTNDYDSSWLQTPDKMESLSEWLVLETEAAKLREKLGAIKNMYKEAHEWLINQLNDNYTEILERLKIGNKILFTIDDEKYGRGYVQPKEKTKATVDDKRGRGLGKSGYWEEYCYTCGNYNSKHYKDINITHYKQLMWILGIKDRKELHPYYQNYRHFTYAQTTGNSLLNQTHPYLTIQDPCSRMMPNGMKLQMYMCGFCSKKRKYQHEEHIINFSNI